MGKDMNVKMTTDCQTLNESAPDGQRVLFLCALALADEISPILIFARSQ